MIVTEREREAETQAEGEAGSMHREPDVGFNPGSPGSRPGPKAGANLPHHPGIPHNVDFLKKGSNWLYSYVQVQAFGLECQCVGDGSTLCS